SMSPEQIPSPDGMIAARKYDIVFQNPGRPLDGSITVASRSRLVRLALPAAGLRVMRSELAGVAVRAQPVRNSNDSDVLIPMPGFTLAGTMTVPREPGKMRRPAVFLVGGSGSVDRDEVVAGIPIF